MRVLTYNIHGWRTQDERPNLDLVANIIAETRADIVGLNEVFYPRAVEGADGPALESLAARLDMHYVFGPCLRWPAQDDVPADAYGNALLSRWPIIASAAHHLTPVPDREQRGLLEGRVLLADNRTFTVYVTHLDYKGETARLTQLRAVRSWIVRDRSRPHIVMGDFNALSSWDMATRPNIQDTLRTYPWIANLTGGDKGSKVIAQMEKAGYVDAYRMHGQPGAQTFIPSGDASVRIDYIFASKTLADGVRSCVIWQEKPGQEASDHRPVLAKVLPPEIPRST